VAPNQQVNYTFFYGKGNENYEQGTDLWHTTVSYRSLAHNRIIPIVKRGLFAIGCHT
jgi:hypothetical protein